MSDLAGAPPNDPALEWSVVAQMLTQPGVIGQVVASHLERDDFWGRDTQTIFDAAVEAHYADERVDPLTIGERCRYPLAQMWGCEESQVGAQLYGRVNGQQFADTAVTHASTLRQIAQKRRLHTLALSCVHAIREGGRSADEIGDMLATEAAAITTGTLLRGELVEWQTAGTRYVEHLSRTKRARDMGIEIGVYTGFDFLDQWTKGIAPTEVMMVAGEPGVGKSAIVWEAARGFAARQRAKDPDKRVGTLILSMEMGDVPSTGRIAQALTGIDGGDLREGKVSDSQIAAVAKGFASAADLPLVFNYAASFRVSQMRALIVDAIRRYNVGLVVIDHFRMFDLDRRVNNQLQEDELKARFLKESIAKDLNVAVICLAHTTKLRREGSDGRPRLADLRGSYQVAAHMDIVSFVYRPIMYASQNEIEEGTVNPDEAELIYEKNRNGRLGTSLFTFRPDRMRVRDQW